MPRDEFEQMKDKVQRLMGEFFRDMRPLSYQPERSFHPPMDIYETEDSLVVIMEIAGMKKDDFQILLDEDLLTIAGTRSESSPARKTRLHQMEIDYGDFERTLRIPFPLKAEGIKAKYNEGFLLVTIPKKKEVKSLNVEVKIQ